MYGINAGKKRKMIVRGIARILAVSLLFGIIGGHADLWTITAQAAEVGNTMMDGDGIVSLGTNNGAVIRKDGSLWMWGNNASGQLGNGTTESSYVPIKIIEDVKAVSLGDTNCAAIKTDNSLWTWGANNISGQLGNGTTEGSYVPVKIMEDVKAVSLGGGHCAAIKTDNSLWIWGANSSGQLGNGTGGTGEITENLIPVKIMEDVKMVSLGFMHSAAIKTDGSLWMWGNNEYGQLGNGEKGENITAPIQIMENVRSVSLGREHSAVIKTDGSLWIWGNNDCGQLGDEKGGTGITGSGIESLVPIKIMENVKSISLGEASSAAINTDGSLWMWGSNDYGELGNGTKTDSLIPIQIMEDVRAVSISSYNSAIVKTDGSLWIWGGNHAGQLGNGMGGWDVEAAVTPYQLMPPGSIPAFGATIPDPSDPDDPDSSEKIYIGENDGPVIKVVDINGRPIADATVVYRSMFSYITSDKGMVTLDNYQSGSEVLIMKSGYKTKIIPDFVNNKEGITTYILTNDPPLASFSDVLDSVLFIRERERIDLLTEEACINTYYKNEKFDIVCTSKDNKYDNYEIYSGEKKIKENTKGEFKNLNPKDFSLDQPVYLSIQKDGENPIKKELNLHVIYFSPPIKEVSFIEDQDIDIGEDIIFLKGQKITINMDQLPIEWYTYSDGTVKAGINVGALSESLVKSKKLSDKIDFLKGATKDNISNYFRKNSTINKYVT